MKKNISRFVLWVFVPRKYKQCSACCLLCKYYNDCIIETKAVYKDLSAGPRTQGAPPKDM